MAQYSEGRGHTEIFFIVPLLWSVQGMPKHVKIRYGRWNEAWGGYQAFLEGLASREGVKRICEIGGGANPALSLEFIREHKLSYVILDISAEELVKAPEGYEKVQADIASPHLDIPGGYDLVFSKMLAEHIRDARQFHENVLSILAEGGIAFHFFPTLYAMPFILNRLMPERLSAILLRTFAPRDSYRFAKFPAYYRWCRGPTHTQIKRFEALGYEVEEYIGFFGHGYYMGIKPLDKLNSFIADILISHPIPSLTSYAYTILRRCEGPHLNHY
ncbi:MAG: class I SAM-dependent methyltransferase [Deltaproteobacteria bacterium]|nr:class I SAM-dependent methyltransferase [Deltaproteobacteria bacterium]